MPPVFHRAPRSRKKVYDGQSDPFARRGSFRHAGPVDLAYACDVDAPEYEPFRAGLAAAGFIESASRHDEHAFGSWYVQVEGDPPFRVCWDGREGWLVIQQRSEDGRWQDVWVARERSEQTLDKLVAEVSSL
jgi:hypothetical protein